MGHHRLASSLFDGICSSFNVRFLTIDRPSAGLSTRIKLSERVRVSHEALLAVLEKEGIRKFEILSHSNGVVYALYTLLHLPDEFEVNRWFMTSPWVPSSISGSIALNLAGYVPGDLTGRLGSLVWGVQKAIGPLGVSMGFVRDWGTWSSGIINTGTGSTKESNTTQLRRKGTPLERIQHFESLQSLKPRDEETFGGSFYPNGMMDLGMKRVLEEGMEGMGEEARVCLRKGCEWGWVQEGEEGISEKELYEKGFGRLKEERRELRVKVWTAGQDGLIPKKGREWMRELLERKEVVREGEWRECKKMGHDEVLGLKCVVEEILRDVSGGER